MTIHHDTTTARRKDVMDDNPLIVTCTHMMERTDGPDMIFVDGGRVTIATCFACADRTNERHAHGVTEPLPDFRTLCPEHAQAAHIPVATKMVDGFYTRQDEQWVRQPSDEDEVN
jgi:hypothetical protein